MKQLNFSARRLISALLVTLFITAAAFAQTTALLYQGRLTDGANSVPAATYQMKFTLHSAVSGLGNQVGAEITDTNVSVVNGVFNVSLDFGAEFPGANRWLEVKVKKSSETEYTTLSPRQQIASVPYSARALSAGSADSFVERVSDAFRDSNINSVSGSKIVGNVANADNATNATNAGDAANLGGVAAANYLQQNGSGANLTNLNAGSVTTGTLPDANLSANVARRDTANTFTGDQTINGNLAQTGTTTDLNLTNGFVTRGTFGTGAIPATGAGSRSMFYPGKAAFRAGQVDGTQWDDANIGSGSTAFGSNNRASGSNSFVFGSSNLASGANSFAFGSSSTASGERSFAFNGTASAAGAIAIGTSAQATNDDAFAFGPSSIATGLASIVIGPSRANGSFSVAIGLQNQARGNFSVVIGKNATDCSGGACIGTTLQPNVVYNGVISISDACAAFSSDSVTATADNQVNIRGCGGFRFFTNRALTSGVTLASGGGTWSSLSDRNMKENFQAVDSRDVLRKVLQLPISTWNYKSQDASIRHIGAMAQDFKAAFNVGENDTTITTVDPDGVAFAAIQGLNEELKDRDVKIEEQQQQLTALTDKIKQQQLVIDALRALICKGNSEAEICKGEMK